MYSCRQIRLCGEKMCLVISQCLAVYWPFSTFLYFFRILVIQSGPFLLLLLALTVAQSKVMDEALQKPETNLLSDYVQKLTCSSAAMRAHEFFAVWIAANFGFGDEIRPLYETKSSIISLIKRRNFVRYRRLQVVSMPGF